MDHHLTAVRGLLGELRENSLRVQLEGGELKVQGHLGPAQLERLRTHKTALLAYLKNPPTWPCATCGTHLFPTPNVMCFWCRAKENAPDCSQRVSRGRNPAPTTQ